MSAETLDELFREACERLKTGGIETPELEADWILEKFLQVHPAERGLRRHERISLTDLKTVLDAIGRRVAGEPLAYILGERDFYGITFKINPDVLIPRPETERLVEWALQWCHNQSRRDLRILDLGTGSGCIGLTLLTHLPEARLTAVDASAGSLNMARENAYRLQLQERTWFHLNDAATFDTGMEKFDLIVANPPYIDKNDPAVAPDVRQFEPHEALFADENGLAAIRTWLKTATRLLAEPGAVGFEIGYKQGAEVLQLFRDAGVFSQQYIIKDFSGNDRLVCGER